MKQTALNNFVLEANTGSTPFNFEQRSSRPPLLFYWYSCSCCSDCCCWLQWRSWLTLCPRGLWLWRYIVMDQECTLRSEGFARTGAVSTQPASRRATRPSWSTLFCTWLDPGSDVCQVLLFVPLKKQRRSTPSRWCLFQADSEYCSFSSATLPWQYCRLAVAVSDCYRWAGRVGGSWLGRGGEEVTERERPGWWKKEKRTTTKPRRSRKSEGRKERERGREGEAERERERWRERGRGRETDREREREIDRDEGK